VLCQSRFKPKTAQITITAATQTVTVSLTLSAQTTVFATVGISSSKGTAYFDGIQLETNSYGDYNLLENGTFDEKSSNVAYGWIDDGYNNTENYTIVSSHSDRNNVLRLNGSPTLPSYVSYSVNNIESYSSYCYIVSGWAKANSSNGFNGNGCAFAIDVVLKYTDNTDDTFRFSFNPVYTGWQNITGIAVPKQGKTVSQVYVYLIYDCNINSCYFDDICLTRGEASCYTYDENGNVSKVVSNSKNTTTMSYSGNNITAVTDEDGTSTYTYDSNNNVKTATSIGGLTTNYNYNTNGTLSNANATDGNQTIYKSYGYNQNGNYITSVTDAYGGTTTSVYDENKGLLTSTTDSMELTTSYTYNNSNDLLTSVMAGSGSSARTVSYNYNNKKQLSSITHNGFNYNFTYDNWGNTNSIKIGTRQLSSSYYHDIHGYLVNFHYGNGWQKYNTYDSLGRVTRNVCVNNDQGYFYSESTYGYNKLGQLTEFYDSLSEVTSTYDYDSVGRLVTTYTSDGSLDTHYSYDSQGRIYSKRYAGHSGLIKSQSIGYNSDGYVRNFTDTATYSFSDIDKFGRVTQNHIINTTSGNTIYTNSYSYRSGSGGANATTTWVSNENTSGFGNFGYSYMPNGNIYWMTATRNGTSYDVLYEYDGLGQLTTEANNYTNQTVYYTYDAGGNITSKRTYTGVWETMIEDSLVTDTYTYGNSEWKDLLTAYNGQTITYDTIGNPLTYRRGETMTWDAGRTLDKIDFDNYGDLLFFDYDTQGMRLRKYGPRVDDYNNTYEADLNYIDYYYDGDTLIYERRSNNGDNVSELFTIEYVYGVNGITGFRIHQGNTTTDYYYVKNIMGDVLGIVNASGTLVAEYRYDAYGNPVMILDGNGNDVSNNYAHIANINPIRYRGYYYDIESGFYYLNSRYYDPVVGRFINADGQLNTSLGVLGCNMYAYCLNNPVNMIDFSGNKPGDLFDTYEDAAIDFGKYINEKSISENREYASYIYEVKVDATITFINPGLFGDSLIARLWRALFGDELYVSFKTKVTKYTYSEPVRGGERDVVGAALWGCLFVSNKVAFVHSHGAYKADLGHGNNIFSPQDKGWANHLDIPIYVATPSGWMRKYDPTTGKDTKVRTFLPRDPNHP